MRLTRHPQSPLLYPNPLNAWEALNVFNCGVVRHNGLFHMLYRAQGVDYVSRIGYAVSADGLRWNRLQQPVLEPHQGRDDYRGVEDPRITPLDGTFYMTYTAFGAHSFFPMIARSDNLITWTDVGPLERAQNKDHVLFPEKIGGRYAILHRRPGQIWIAYSDDLIHWDGQQVIMSPRLDNGWDSVSIGSNGVPIRTDHGWLLCYHGYDAAHVYRQSVALLDLEDPTQVIHRPQEFIMEPSEWWEIHGDVPNVVFSCAALVVGEDLYCYYGGADRLIGLATAPFADVMAFAQQG
ncbi:MAG: glycosidase [Anaerolineae bacterium]|nr:glycosidase [Anaerolineae bacterium]